MPSVYSGRHSVPHFSFPFVLMRVVSSVELTGALTVDSHDTPHVRFFLLAEAFAVVPSLYPFFTFLAKCLNVRILPVP